MVEIFDNIRKIYTFSAACAELADYIDFFSESSFEETKKYVSGKSFSVKMFASWTPTFYINLGAPYQLALGEKKYYVRPTDDVLILRNSIVQRHNLPTDHIFTVKFFPGGLEAIFGVNQTKLADQVVDLHQIIPSVIIQKVRSLHSFDERKMYLQNYFLSVFQKKRTGDHYIRLVQDIMHVYESGNMQLNNNQLAEKMFVTSKTINRYFNHVIGTTPKNYFLIFRARTALTAYVSDKKSFVPTDFGYYDMSHFHKDVVKFTGKAISDKR